MSEEGADRKGRMTSMSTTKAANALRDLREGGWRRPSANRQAGLVRKVALVGRRGLTRSAQVRFATAPAGVASDPGAFASTDFKS
jgi:hypothetical protein